MRIRPTLADEAGELLALVHACDIATVGFPDYDLSEVERALKMPFTVAAVADDGTIAGWAFLDDGGGAEKDWLDLYTHPGYGEAARKPLLEAAMDAVAGRGRVTRAGAVPTEAAWSAALEEAGFVFSKQSARMTIDLPAAVEEVPGIDVRPVRQEELEEFYQVIDSAFQDTPDYNHRTYSQWRERWIEHDTVHWDEWLAVHVDGKLVGALQSKAGDEGWVQNLGVLRDFRQRGIGRALLGEALRVYSAKGYPTAGLGVDLANPTQPIKLYTAMGMTPAYRVNIYELEPVGATGPSA